MRLRAPGLVLPLSHRGQRLQPLQRQHRLSLDLRRYFLSIKHDILLEILLRRLHGQRTSRLLEGLIRTGGAVFSTVWSPVG